MLTADAVLRFKLNMVIYNANLTEKLIRPPFEYIYHVPVLESDWNFSCTLKYKKARYLIKTLFKTSLYCIVIGVTIGIANFSSTVYGEVFQNTVARFDPGKLRNYESDYKKYFTNGKLHYP